MDTAIAVVALALAGSWIGYFLFTPMPSLTFEVFPATVTLHIVAGAVLAVYVVYLAIARRLPGGTPLDLPVLAFLGAYALATYASIDWRASLEPVLLLGAAVVAFYALSDLPFLTARTLRYAFMLVSARAVAVRAVGRRQRLRRLPAADATRSRGSARATSSRRRCRASTTSATTRTCWRWCWCWCCRSTRSARSGRRRCGSASPACAGLFVAGWAIFLTLSRGGWIGAGVGVGVHARRRVDHGARVRARSGRRAA